MAADSRRGLHARLQRHLTALYPEHDASDLARELLATMGVAEPTAAVLPRRNAWDQRDVLAITYANSITRSGEQPLETLRGFLSRELADTVSGVHILPFFPYSSDDGFSILEYLAVNESFGDWEHIEAIAGEFDLMVDVVINHMSARSRWFENFKRGVDPGRDYFFTASPDDALDQVVRPRTSPLLQEVETAEGTRHVWCTFSHDQVDLDFRNPKVLVEFVNIIATYLDHGAKILRMDAVAFLWKRVGTPCIHLPETHRVIKVLRLLLEHRDPECWLITETNVPNRENLTYFGNANEAHLVYNFSLPPLIVHTLITGNCDHLNTWLMSMPPARAGTAYLNFLASHDGIGLRPAQGLLTDEELEQLTGTMQRFGGALSMRRVEGGFDRPYEINISLFDALRGTVRNDGDHWQIDRFVCAHAIMLGLEGVPAIYIHSFLGTASDHERYARTRRKRTLNRHRWDADDLERRLAEPCDHHRTVFDALRRLVQLRRRQPAFHPNATQFTLHLGPALFAFWRQSMDREQSIFCVSNVTDEPQVLMLSELNLISTDDWWDLVSGTRLVEDQIRITLEPYQTVWLTNQDRSADSEASQGIPMP